MPAALARSFAHTYTSKIPLLHYQRATTYLWALVWIGVDLAFGKGSALVEVLVGQILFCYLLVGSLGELYFHRRVLTTDDKVIKERRYRQALQEILVATEALVGVCAFSCAGAAAIICAGPALLNTRDRVHRHASPIPC